MDMNEKVRQDRRRRIKMGAILWLFCLQLLPVEWHVAGGYTPHYSFAYGYMSELGSSLCNQRLQLTCSPRHLEINISMALEGILLVLGAIMVRRTFNARPGFTAATTLMVLSGLGIFWAGAAPVDIADKLNLVASNTYLIAGGLAILTYGISMFLNPAQRMLPAVASVLFGLPLLCAGIMTAAGSGNMFEASGAPQGIVYRLAAYGIPLWAVAMGIVVLVGKCVEAPPLPGKYLPPPPPPRMRD